MIEPLFGMVAPKHVVEIGTLRGETTLHLLDSLGPDAQLHVIDPAPQFDPTEHERRFAGRYVFHREISLNVLPKLEPVDVALVDGDHNWYTVINELRLLRDGADAAGHPVPLFVLHDVCWPYGRRDGYYEPSSIPRRYRHRCAQLGLERGNPGLLDEGGVNRNIWNARHEGGRRNGVLTAVEDFLADRPTRFRHVVIDAYSGLGVIADREQIAALPDLGAFFENLSTDDGQAKLKTRAQEVVQEAAASGTLRLD